MKVRIKPQKGNCGSMEYVLQLKRWWGWKSIGEALYLSWCLDWIEELRKITNDVKIIKYV